MFRTKRIIFFSLIPLFSIVLALPGCSFVSQFFPLHDSQRYKGINNVLDYLDYETAGTNPTGTYDNGDGVLSPSFFRGSVYGGEKTFKILGERARSIPNSDCSYSSTTQVKCSIGQVNFRISPEKEGSDRILFQLTDVYSGK